MKATTIFLSLLLASQALPGILPAAAAQTVNEPRAESDDRLDTMQLKLAYRLAVYKLKKQAPAYSYDEVTDRVETFQDGNQLKTSKTASYVRDQEGHMRIASTSLRGAERITYVDPATQTAYLIRSDRKDVLRMTGDALSDSPRTATTARSQPDNYRTTVHAQLGVKEIAGVQAKGISGVTTIPAGTLGNEKDMVDTYEYWYAQDIGEFVYRHSVSARYGESTVHVENLKLGNVSALSFEVPDGYQVRDVVIPTETVAQQ